MFIATDKKPERGFTLFEIMLAVAILATMSIAVYRFVQSNLLALRVSSETSLIDARYDGLRDLLTAQWQSLAKGVGAMTGDAVKVNDNSRDEITWRCGPGPGLLTRYANSDYLVSMELRAESGDPEKTDLGFARRPYEDQAATNVHESWIPLIPDVQSLEIRYYDPRLNAWQDRWSDNVALPRLVRISIGRKDTTVPWQVIVALGHSSL